MYRGSNGLIYVFFFSKNHPYFLKKKSYCILISKLKRATRVMSLPPVLLFYRCCDSCINNYTRLIFLCSDCHRAPFLLKIVKYDDGMLFNLSIRLYKGAIFFEAHLQSGIVKLCADKVASLFQFCFFFL